MKRRGDEAPSNEGSVAEHRVPQQLFFSLNAPVCRLMRRVAILLALEKSGASCSLVQPVVVS
jgi:hypothetical protein